MDQNVASVARNQVVICTGVWARLLVWQQVGCWCMCWLKAAARLDRPGNSQHGSIVSAPPISAVPAQSATNPASTAVFADQVCLRMSVMRRTWMHCEQLKKQRRWSQGRRCAAA